MLDKKFSFLSIVLATFLLTGCGGDSSSSTGTGYYVDSPIEGVNYKCGSESGTTGDNGKFTFEVGQNCTFTLADITLRTVPSNLLYDNVDVIEDNLDVARFLQSIDMDGDHSNGIQLNQQIVQTIKDMNITQIPYTDQKIDDIVSKLSASIAGFNGKVISKDDALDNLNQTLTENTKAALAGKTFYAVSQDNGEVDYGKLVFNKDATSLTFANLLSNIGEVDTEYFTIDGRKIIWEDGSYSTLEEITPSYLVFQDYDNVVPSVTKAFVDQKQAEEYYNKIKPKELKFTTSYLNNKTFYDTYQDGNEWQIDALHWTDKILYDDNGDSVNYEITPEGYIFFNTEDDGSQYIKLLEKNDHYLKVCWGHSEDEVKNCSNEEYFFFNKNQAEDFIKNPILL